MSRDRLHRVGGKWVELPEKTVARPAESAPKAEWVTYADALGVDPSGTKAQIVARCGDQPIEPVEGVDQVDAVALVDEQGAQVEQLPEGEPGADLLDDDTDALRHEDRG